MEAEVNNIQNETVETAEYQNAPKKKREFRDEATEAWYFIGKIFIGIIIAVFVVFLLWGDRITSGKTGCTFFLLFHLYCPGCGATRATYWLFHLHPWRSFLCNPFIIVSGVLYLVFMVNTFLCLHTKKLGTVKMPVTAMVYADLALLILQCVIRNILFVAFHITCL